MAYLIFLCFWLPFLAELKWWLVVDRNVRAFEIFEEKIGYFLFTIRIGRSFDIFWVEIILEPAERFLGGLLVTQGRGEWLLLNIYLARLWNCMHLLFVKGRFAFFLIPHQFYLKLIIIFEFFCSIFRYFTDFVVIWKNWYQF